MSFNWVGEREMKKKIFRTGLLLGVQTAAILALFFLAKPGLCLQSGTTPSFIKLDNHLDLADVRASYNQHQTVDEMDVYFVSIDGNDDNPGTEELPFRTITKGVTVLDAGDTLYIRKGVYSERFQINASGSQNNPITISAYPGEHPVIDAQNTLPGTLHDYLVILRGDYITLSSLEIRNVYGIAVFVRGNYNTVSNMRIHHTLQEGILVAGSDGVSCVNGITNTSNVIENNEIWMASLRHEEVKSGGNWTAGISVGRCPEYTVVRRNTIYNNWGMAIQVFEAYTTTIEDNIAWNNQRSHYYINNAPYTVLQRNLSYNTPDTTYLYNDAPGVSIALADEKSAPVSHHIRVINNLTLGGAHGIFFFYQYPGSGLKNSIIAQNTLIDSISAGITIHNGDHQNTRIYNNIVSGDTTVVYVPDNPELHFSHNLWSNVPPASVASPNDVVGRPYLSKIGTKAPGHLDSRWFELLSYSPAIDAGIALNEISEDFDNVPRPQGPGNDIGAFEYRNRIADLYITDGVVDMPEITYSMQWTAPTAAIEYEMRRSDSWITSDNWDKAIEVSVPFTPSAPGSSELLTTIVPYSGAVDFFAVRFKNNSGIWSKVSNNGFWPTKELLLPIVYIEYDKSELNSGIKFWDRQLNCITWSLIICLSGYMSLIVVNNKMHNKIVFS
jgi:hypothetical protein